MQKKEQHEMKTVLHFSLLRIAAGLAGALIAASSSAAPVDEAMAAKALAAWRVRRGTLGVTMGMTVERVRCIRREGLAFHVVQFAGGGVALAAAETTIRPVMLFSADADFDEDPENPAWALLRTEFDERERRYAAADADGGQRVYNGALDLGCFEADWRGTYARDISKSSRFSVSAATPNGVEDGEDPGGREAVRRVARQGRRHLRPDRHAAGKRHADDHVERHGRRDGRGSGRRADAEA